MLNAYTSHDLVAFHITCRAEVVGEAIDLLTDFVGRPKIDQEELDRERGVVIQEIARANDQPSVMAEHLIDRAAFGDHPLGRPVLGPEEHLRTFSRDAILAFRRRQWAGGARRRVPRRQPRARARATRSWSRRSAASRRSRPNGSYEPAPPFTPQTLVEPRDSNQSHLRISYRPSIDPRDQRQRAALAVYGTLLGGSMGSRLFDEIREQRGLAYSVYSVDHSFADVPILQLSAGLESGKCVEAYTRMREIVDELRTDGPREEEVERARAYAAGRRVLAFENTNAVARHAATQTVVHGQEVDPDAAIALLDEVTFDQVAEVARGISEEASVACVGPHEVVRVRIDARSRNGHRRAGGVEVGSARMRSNPPSCSSACAAAACCARGRRPPWRSPSRRRRPAARPQRLPRQPRAADRASSGTILPAPGAGRSRPAAPPTSPSTSASSSAANRNTLVVSAGDLIGASPLLSALFHDEPTIEAMNKIGLDLNAVGNHEFDEGDDRALRMQDGGCHAERHRRHVQGLRSASSGAPNSGFLAANVVRADTGTAAVRRRTRSRSSTASRSGSSA